jgi:hypothetical protein
MFAVFHFRGALFTNTKTGAAAYAVGRDKGQLVGPYQNTFWVMAPKATQLAAFEKNGAPYAGTVMNGKMLNFKYTALHMSNSTFPA